MKSALKKLSCSTALLKRYNYWFTILIGASTVHERKS